MRIAVDRLLRATAPLGLAAFLFAASGCGDSQTSQVPPDEETKKIDQGVQNGMKEFMQSKTQSKTATKK